MNRTILHSDMNCFYASVEMMLNPELQGKAVAVCGSTENRHGIVLAKSEKEVHKAVDIQNQSYKMNIDEVELLDEYKEKLLAMRIEIIKLKAENQKLESELDFLRRQQEGVSDVK